LIRIWSVPAFEVLETQTLGGTFTWLWDTPAGILATTRVKDEPREVEVAAVALGSPPRRIGRVQGLNNWRIDPAGTSLAFARDNALYVRSLADGMEPPRQVGTFEGPPGIIFHPAGDRLAVYDPAPREIRLWATRGGEPAPVRVLAPRFKPLSDFTFDPAGRRLAAIGTTPKGLGVDVWALDAPVTAGPFSFPAPFGGFLYQAVFSPDGRWLATANFHAVCFWPMRGSEPQVLLGHQQRVIDVEFTPDSGRLVSVDESGEIREWKLGRDGTSRTLARVGGGSAIRIDSRGRFLVKGQQGGARVVPLDGGESRSLRGFGPTTGILGVAIDPDGRRVAATALRGPAKDKVIRVWDLETEEVWTLGPTEQAGEGFAGQNLGLRFLPDGSLLSAGDGGLRRWDLASGSREVLASSHPQSHLAVSKDGRTAAYVATNHGDSGAESRQIESVSLAIMDLATRKTRIVPSHGSRIMPLEMDDRGAVVVTGGLDGIVRVGPVTGEEPHLLLGHEGFIHGVAISPDGRWVASGGDDGTVRVWPMPDLSQPPLHTLPHEELLARLKSLTNVRVVEESASTISAWLRTARGSGYELDIVSFPGWAKAREP
jgi:WD40 repeat protein